MVNYITGRWATKYKYLPDDIRFEGSCEERIQHLKARGYGLYSNIPPHRGIVWWQQNCHTAVTQYQSKEKQRLADIKKAEETKIQLQREQTIYDAGVKEAQRLQKVAEDKRLQQIKDQEITFNEQTNSGDFNETPITDVNVNSGCSECTDPIIEKEPLNNNMKFVGITVIGIVALLVVTK